MKKDVMDKERFLACLEAYGADVARWPENERDEARALMRAAPAETARAIAEAGALDRVLAEAPEQDVNAALLGRVLASAPRPRASGGLAGGLAGVFGAGWSAGGLAGVLDDARPRAAVLAASVLLALGSVYAGWTASRVATAAAAEEAFIAALYSESYEALFTEEQLTNQLNGAELDG